MEQVGKARKLSLFPFSAAIATNKGNSMGCLGKPEINHPFQSVANFGAQNNSFIGDR
jgi:hypothetical protein